MDIVPGWKDVLKLNPAQCGRTLKFLLTVLLHSLLSLFMGDSTSLTPLAFLWQPLALLGCHITPSSLCCLSSLLSPSFLLPVYCIPFSSHCVSRQLFGKGVIIGQYHTSHDELSVCSGCLSLSLFSCPPHLSLSLFQFPLLVTCPWQLCVTFIPETCCPLKTLPIIPCIAAT